MLGASRYPVKEQGKTQQVKGEPKSQPDKIHEGVVATVIPQSTAKLSIDKSGFDGEVAYAVHFEGAYPFDVPSIKENQPSPQIKIDGEWLSLYQIMSWDNGPQPHSKNIAVRANR